MSIKVENLEKRYPGAPAPTLRGVNLELAKGRIAAILGGSGAGKSTLLRCLIGLESFETGAIDIDGVRIEGSAKAGPAEKERRLTLLRGRVGLVFQSFELFPHLTVLDNCTLAPRKVRGKTKEEAEQKARELLVKLGLEARINAYPEQLSGGQKQRVAIARALAMEPAVLLYDEPTSALDPSLRNEVKAALQGVAETGVTQVVVTHDVEFARTGTDVVFVLDAGAIAETGPSKEVLGNPQHAATKKLVAH